ncbi:spermidine resistance protein [Peltigera leucophlebia]|nr:spermidine resistance protein [Peltigera leucophlebia]
MGNLLILAFLLAGHQVGKANSTRTSRLKKVIVPVYRTEMVNTEIPKHYTASPSSYGGTPHLTINHDVAADLDSNNAFEGPEKLLEVWFSASAHCLPIATAPEGLKVVPAAVWKDMLDLVNCKVLSIIESENVDAYLLSESSMFVFPHKIILKTCGTTTLLNGLPRLLEIAAVVARFPHSVGDLVKGTPTVAMPYRVFYSRKNFLYPDRQRGPHRSWRDEVKSLDRLFLGGSAYMIGKMNGEHWYLYLTEPNTILTPPATPDRVEIKTKVLYLPGPETAIETYMDEENNGRDETLEVLMTDLDEENARQFYLDHASAVAEGRYYQQAHTTRAAPKLHLSSINEENAEDLKLFGDSYNHAPNHDDVVDVFSNTSSDSDEVLSTEELTFPEELTTEGHALGTVVSETSGLSDVYPLSKFPDARVDAYLFTPCGFSANGVIPSSGGSDATHYFTVHVTPEPHCSYASFETNVPSRQTGRETADVIEQVVGIFKPGRFSVTLFEAKATDDGFAIEDDDFRGKLRALELQAARKSMRMDNIRGYRRVDRIVHDLDGYELVFKYYERHDWEGGVPRLGEFCY